MPRVEKRMWRGSKTERIYSLFFHRTQTWQCAAMWNLCNQTEDKTHRKHEAVTKSLYYLWTLGTAIRFIWWKGCLRTANFIMMKCFSLENFSSDLWLHNAVTHSILILIGKFQSRICHLFLYLFISLSLPSQVLYLWATSLRSLSNILIVK